MRKVIFCAIAETILIFLKMFILLLTCLHIYMHMSVSTLRALNPLVTDLQVMVKSSDLGAGNRAPVLEDQHAP